MTDLKMATQMIRAVLETMEDGALEPEEALFLCQTAKGILEKLETSQRDKRFIRIGVWAALSIVEKLEHDIGEAIEKERDQ
jgi:hypothetical protein